MDSYMKEQREKKDKYQSLIMPNSEQSKTHYIIILATFLLTALALYHTRPKFINNKEDMVCPYRVFGISLGVSAMVYMYLFKL